MTKHEARFFKEKSRKMLQDLSDRIELMETMIEEKSISFESIRILQVELNGLYAESMSIALKGLKIKKGYI